ncbi:MAG: ABC transporter permease [Deltaproteobacteria bacterium]|nr:ABC transporter permease [Deltaproteobacteria bacterium]MBW2306590.1 ABC transporter permease [Deltaproteobacteria bacterium]
MFLLDRKAIRAFKRNKAAVIGLILLALLVFTAIFANLLAPYDVREQNIRQRYSPPGAKHVLGTDDLGRDVLSRIILGSRVSLYVGISSVFFSLCIGVVLGLFAGYKGGHVDNFITRIIDMLMSFPSLLLGILVVSALGPGLRNAIIAIALAFIPRFARVARGPTLALKEQEFVLACRAAGASEMRIIFIHILPNLVGELVVMASLWMATAIIIESSLSFLGLGVQPPTPSWGMMIKRGVDEILIAPWLAVFPGIAISIAVLAFNLIGDGMRDLLDPKTRGELAG